MREVEELRRRIHGKLADGIPEPLGQFDHKDLARLEDDRYLARVISHCDGNLEDAVNMLWTTMIWRQEEQVNEIGDTVKMEYVKLGLFFPRGRDADGSLLLIMKWKLYSKDHSTEELKKVFVYWLERLEREEDGKPLTLFFDLEGCGVNNGDVELIRYMVTVLKTYYPKLVSKIIIYQMPWILTAAYRVVKGLLPEKAVRKLRVVSKETLGELIPDQALKCWGGDDDYTFQFVPEGTPSWSELVTTGEDDHGILRVLPDDYLTFTDDANVKSELIITNTITGYVAYRIRGTGPDKFRVKPGSGVLPPGSSQTVTITVAPGVDVSEAMKERFMVVAAGIRGEKVSQELVDEVWRNPRRQCKLKCKLSDAGYGSGDLVDYLDKFGMKHEELGYDLDAVQLYQILTFGFSILLVIFEYLIFKRCLC